LQAQPSGVLPYTHLSTRSLQDTADSADDIISNAMKKSA
jgi:hypothetical protein